MSSSSFMSCPRCSDRGTTSWIRKFSAVLNIKQAAARRLNKQPTCFCKCWICSSFLTFLASQCRLYWGPVSEPTGSKTLFHLLFPAQTPSVHHYTEQQLYINNMLVPEEYKFVKPKYEMGGRQGRGADQPQWNRVLFFFFSTKKRWQSKCSFVAKSSSILHLDVCAQTLTHTRSDAITCTFKSDKKTEHDCDVFYNCFSENVLHLFSQWRTPHKRII